MSVGTSLFLLTRLRTSVYLNASVWTFYKDFTIFSDKCVFLSIVRTSHPGLSPGGFLSRWKESSIAVEGEVVVEVAGQLGEGWVWESNGPRNRPCSTAPDSLIMVSAVNVFGVRE